MAHILANARGAKHIQFPSSWTFGSDAKCVVVRMTCRMPWRSVTAAATSPGLQRSDPKGMACTESEGHVGNSNAERTARQSS